MSRMAAGHPPTDAWTLIASAESTASPVSRRSSSPVSFAESEDRRPSAPPRRPWPGDGTVGTGLCRESSDRMEPAGRGSEEAIDECRDRAAASGVKIIENENDIPLQVVQRLANRLAQLSRTEAIRHGEQGEEVLLDARGDAVERNRGWAANRVRSASRASTVTQAASTSRVRSHVMIELVFPCPAGAVTTVSHRDSTRSSRASRCGRRTHAPERTGRSILERLMVSGEVGDANTLMPPSYSLGLAKSSRNSLGRGDAGRRSRRGHRQPGPG